MIGMNCESHMKHKYAAWHIAELLINVEMEEDSEWWIGYGCVKYWRSLI